MRFIRFFLFIPSKWGITNFKSPQTSTKRMVRPDFAKLLWFRIWKIWSIHDLHPVLYIIYERKQYYLGIQLNLNVKTHSHNMISLLSCHLLISFKFFSALILTLFCILQLNVFRYLELMSLKDLLDINLGYYFFFK